MLHAVEHLGHELFCLPLKPVLLFHWGADNAGIKEVPAAVVEDVHAAEAVAFLAFLPDQCER